MRAAALAAAGLAGLGLAVVPALAADSATVTVGPGSSFTPQSVTVDVGGTVTWSYPEGSASHNVTFADGYAEPPSPSGPGWQADRTFETAGTFSYRCGLHSSMTGTVVVGDGGGTTTGTTTTGTTTTGTTTTTTTGTEPAPTVTPQAEGFTASPTRRRFCAKRSERCRKPGFVIRVDLDADGTRTIDGQLSRRGAIVGALRFEAQPGEADYRFKRVAGKRLKRGRHRLELALGSATQTVAFRMR